MARRVAMGAVLAAVVLAATALYAVRANGLLGGRDHDGPVETWGTLISFSGKPGRSITVNDLHVTNRAGETAVLESATVVAAGPGLEILGTVSEGFHNRRIGFESFPPRRWIPIEGARLDPGEEWSLGVGMRAQQPGRYGWRNLKLRYRIGSRRFEEMIEADVELRVARRR